MNIRTVQSLIGESGNDNAADSEEMSEAFRAMGLFLYEFSQLEFTLRGLLTGFEDSSEKEPEMAPEYFPSLCDEAQKFFAEKFLDSENR